MKKIQQKLREILGNTSRVAKHLACGNLPSRETVLETWSEATGKIYSARLTSLASGIEKLAEYHNPYELTLTGSYAAGIFTLNLANVPNTLNATVGKLYATAECCTNAASGIVPIIVVREYAYNSTTNVAQFLIYVYDATTDGTACDVQDSDEFIINVWLQ